jgi:N-acetyl-anhydromuramyl-L-alanine amidase AmpD
MNIGAKEIREWHVVGNGWRDIGYNYVITRDGDVQNGRDTDRDGDVDEEIGAHAKGFNTNSIGICLVGGIDDDRNADANFTFVQYVALNNLVQDLISKYPDVEILGHRDLPNSNKECPSFDVKSFFS